MFAGMNPHERLYGKYEPESINLWTVRARSDKKQIKKSHSRTNPKFVY